ncbi:MAG: flavodoxin family protein, partial [Candidatus Thorarchaeota archaeon]
MKCLFIYFSSTGITAKLAHEIAKGIRSKEQVEVDFVRMKEGLIIDPDSYDIFGFGAPSYSLHAPRMVIRMLRMIDFQKKPFFVFATYNTMVGNTNWSLYRAVKSTAGICLGHLKTSVTVNIRAWKPKKNSNKKMKEFTTAHSSEACTFGQLIYERYMEIQQTNIQKQNKNWKP